MFLFERKSIDNELCYMKSISVENNSLEYRIE